MLVLLQGAKKCPPPRSRTLRNRGYSAWWHAMGSISV